MVAAIEMDSFSSSVQDLRDLLEEYFVAIEVEQHDEVGRLASKICCALVELLDFHEREYGESSELTTIVDGVCHRLRVQGRLATTYKQVIEFVHIRDLVSLGKLHNALPKGDAYQGTQDWLILNYDKFVRTLRASIDLLTHLNNRDGEQTGQCWLDWREIRRVEQIGFCLSHFDLDTVSSNIGDEAGAICKIVNLAKGLDGPTIERSLSSLLRSGFFVTFCEQTLAQSYPIDRFPILVAVWIIAIDCRHSSAEQLLDELISQIFHQETNTTSLDELGQLHQVGSVWLSHHRRHKVSYKQPNWQNVDSDDYLDNQMSDADSSSSLSQTPSDKLQNQATPEAPVLDLHAKLRQVIDEEFMRARPCPVCGHRSGKMLSCLDCGPCESCALEMSSVRLARTNRNIELLDLRVLKKSLPKLSKVVLVSPRQWARHLIRSQAKKMRAHDERDGQRTIIEERVDISDKFERLTVIRNTDDDDDDDDDDDEDDERSGSSWAEDEEDQLTSCNSYELILDAFMEQSSAECWSSQWTESVRLLSWMTQSENYKLSQLLPLCTSDLLLMNSCLHAGGLQLDLRLSTRSDWSQGGKLWSCLARSSSASDTGLQMGCGRLFDSLELTRLDHMEPISGTNNVRCPNCRLQLSEIQTLDTRLQGPPLSRLTFAQSSSPLAD